MKRKTIIVSLLVLVLGTVAIAFGLTMFQIQDDEPVAEHHQHDTQQLTRNEKTALEAARIMTTWNPATDYNRTAAEVRASHLMTDERANKIEQPERAASGQGWNEAARQGATSTPSVEINYHTDMEASTVAVCATCEWTTDDNQSTIQEDEERIYYVAFNDQGEIHDYTYETVRYSHEKTQENSDTLLQ